MHDINLPTEFGKCMIDVASFVMTLADDIFYQKLFLFLKKNIICAFFPWMWAKQKQTGRGNKYGRKNVIHKCINRHSFNKECVLKKTMTLAKN